MSLHPFDALQDAELRLASKLMKDHYPALFGIHFLQIDRQEPPKKDMLKYLEAERAGKPLPEVPRRAYVVYTDKENLCYKAIVNLLYRHVITAQKMPEGTVGPMLPEDVLAIENMAVNHPAVLAEMAKLKVPKGFTLRAEPWIYGTDDADEKRTLIQFYMYLIGLNLHIELNHYSLPLKFLPVFENHTHKLVRMDYLPGGADELTATSQEPWKVRKPVEYWPEICEAAQTPRELKPLIYQQPEGPSFTVHDKLKITWQGWEFRCVANAREGVVIYDAWFKGRQVLYRLSLSEMTVPYGDPRAPYHRKQAFDLGDCGFGVNGDLLALGCDCLGVIKYMDCIRLNDKGEPVLIPSTICMHEQDYGLGYKHVNYRTFELVQTRRREFVVQTIATVANYEYIVNFVFDQVGQISIQVRATGILSTMPIDDGVVVPWGTNVGDGVMAAYHQHLLLFRVDMAVDGHNNTVVYDDVVPMKKDPKLNPYGVGFVTERLVVDKAGFIPQLPFTNRAVKVINESRINPVSGKPVAYKIETPARQMILALEELYNTKRAHFGTQQFWVLPYKDDQLYAAGDFTNQLQKDTGIAEWVKTNESVRNTDVVMFVTMALTHVPRVEDFPVMPSDMLPPINIVPFGFFHELPLCDVPQSTNKANKSVYYEESIAEKKELLCCLKI